MAEDSVFFHQDALIVDEWELHGCLGFALHIGSSLVKIAYIGHVDYHESLNPEFNKVTLELRSADIENIDKVIQFIKDNLYEQRGSRHRLKYLAILTGYHGLEYKERLEQQLPGIIVKLTDTFQAYAKYHQFGVISIGRPTFLYGVLKCPSKSEPSTSDDVIKLLANQNADTGIEGPGTDFPERFSSDYNENIKKEFPYLLCVIGGDVTYLKISEEGRIEPCVLDRSGYGGASFHALAKLITGNKNYRELLELANNGDYKAAGYSRPVSDFPDRSMDCHVEFEGLLDREVALAGGPDKHVLLKPMDNIVRGHQMKPEDTVASVMHMTCERIVTNAISLARKNEIGKVYFAGSFCEKNDLLKECVRNAPVYDMRNTGPEMYVGFTKHGMYAGALGALLDGLYLMQFLMICCGGGSCGPPRPPMIRPDMEISPDVDDEGDN